MPSSFSPIWKSLFRRQSTNNLSRSRRRRRRTWLPMVEWLEPRLQLTATVALNFYANAAEPSTNGGFRLSRSGGDITQSLTVTYTISGTATNGVDYTTLSDSATFAPFVSVADINVAVIDDKEIEGTESVVLALQDGTGYTVQDGKRTATVSITDDDGGQGTLPPPDTCPDPGGT